MAVVFGSSREVETGYDRVRAGAPLERSGARATSFAGRRPGSFDSRHAVRRVAALPARPTRRALGLGGGRNSNDLESEPATALPMSHGSATSRTSSTVIDGGSEKHPASGEIEDDRGDSKRFTAFKTNGAKRYAAALIRLDGALPLVVGLLVFADRGAAAYLAIDGWRSVYPRERLPCCSPGHLCVHQRRHAGGRPDQRKL